jgi:hypothetical protein
LIAKLQTVARKNWSLRQYHTRLMNGSISPILYIDTVADAECSNNPHDCIQVGDGDFVYLADNIAAQV